MSPDGTDHDDLALAEELATWVALSEQSMLKVADANDMDDGSHDHHSSPSQSSQRQEYRSGKVRVHFPEATSSLGPTFDDDSIGDSLLDGP